MKKRKRIALLVGQVWEDYQKNFIEGFFENAFAADYDVCVFTIYQKYQASVLREAGEANIFSLIPYDQFAAIVLVSDTITSRGTIPHIEAQLKRSYKGVVLSVERESPYFPNIMTEQYKPMLRMVEHLIEHHGYKKIAFLTGKKNHPHSKLRLQAFLDCMKVHGLEVPEEWIYYGDFWYSGGANFAMELMKNPDHLPEAIACANDYMAISVAETLEKFGVKVPEDIAIVGYDSVEEGQNSPQPITSMRVPAKKFGAYAFDSVLSLLRGEAIQPFCDDEPLFIGSSCGCSCESVKPRTMLREHWQTNEAEIAINSNLNYLLEDLISQQTFKGVIEAIQTYTYQIRPLHSFYLCLNDLWISEDRPASTNIIRQGYTDQIVPVLSCGPSGEGADQINYISTFDKRDLLPELCCEHMKPQGYFFSPIYFDDMCFGYAAFSYGNEIKCINESYFLWLRYVMLGLECFRRVDALRKSEEIVEERQIVDSLTGIFNYEGFMKHSNPMLARAQKENQFISVMAVDVAGLEQINAQYSRKEGDRAIATLSELIQQCIDEDGMCCRLGNDEFIIAELTMEPTNKKIHGIRKKLEDRLKVHNSALDLLYPLQIFSGSSTARVDDYEEMEYLINAAVSRKNGNKASEMRIKTATKLTPEEIGEMNVVTQILDENLFQYHFQPIVDAHTGEIFAYEALMRAKVTPYVSPLDILKYATHLNRLQDVERATFFNILQLIEDNGTSFEEKKVFINSIPGNQLTGEEAHTLNQLLAKNAEHVVVELTEQTEADDETLAQMKSGYQSIGVETAVDDYGTGYSNIVNLLRYMPNYVKIDRMLLTEIQDNPQKQHFVREIVNFAHDNHFKVLAEGIETTEELGTVIELNVDLIQGYYTGRPNPDILQTINGHIKDEIVHYNQDRDDKKQLA